MKVLCTSGMKFLSNITCKHIKIGNLNIIQFLSFKWKHISLNSLHHIIWLGVMNLIHLLYTETRDVLSFVQCINWLKKTVEIRCRQSNMHSDKCMCQSSAFHDASTRLRCTLLDISNNSINQTGWMQVSWVTFYRTIILPKGLHGCQLWKNVFPSNSHTIAGTVPIYERQS